ncbi:MAG: hypothetical protein V3R98_06945 [Alphaproteobacteria bacterium]
MGNGFTSPWSSLRALAIMLATATLLSGCGTAISAVGTVISTTADLATDAVVTTVDIATMPFGGGDEQTDIDD